MTAYQSVNVKLSNFQLDKLKSAAKKLTSVTLRLLSDMIGTNENNVSHNLLVTDKQITSLWKFCLNNLMKYTKLPKIQLSKMVQSSGFPGRLL